MARLEPENQTPVSYTGGDASGAVVHVPGGAKEMRIMPRSLFAARAIEADGVYLIEAVFVFAASNASKFRPQE